MDERNLILQSVADVLGSGPVIFIELGAHRGTDSVQLMKILPAGTVFYAVEPDPRSFPVLAQSLAGKGICFCAAIGAENGTTLLHMSSGDPQPDDPNGTASSSIRKPKQHLHLFPNRQFDCSELVPVWTLDRLAGRLGLSRIDFIWADIQGAEVDLIRGGQNALKRTRFLLTEYDERELYEGQVGLSEWKAMLPGEWEIVRKFGGDVLLCNAGFRSD